MLILEQKLAVGIENMTFVYFMIQNLNEQIRQVIVTSDSKEVLAFEVSKLRFDGL